MNEPKIHFGWKENCGDYMNPEYSIEHTLCGIWSERITEGYTFDNWSVVTCRRCLKTKKEPNNGG
jgi:hypothetical protein